MYIEYINVQAVFVYLTFNLSTPLFNVVIKQSSWFLHIVKIATLCFCLPNQNVFSIVSWQVDWHCKSFCLLRCIENSPVWVGFYWASVKVHTLQQFALAFELPLSYWHVWIFPAAVGFFLANKVQKRCSTTISDVLVNALCHSK